MLRTTGQFQFQYGAIVRCYEYSFESQIFKFQFQYGAIVRRKAKTICLNAKQFQFQYGAIVRNMPFVEEAKTFISIPVWCDCKCFSGYRSNRAQVFQFQYGAIVSTRKKLLFISSMLFQFQYGAIVSKML